MRRARSGLSSLRQLSWDELRVLGRSLVTLPVVARLIRTRSFAEAEQWCASSRPARLLLGPHRAIMLRNGDAGDAAGVGRCVSLASSAWRRIGISCLPQSLVLRELLVRRGVPATIRFGARRSTSTLEAHAWVEVDGRPVNETADVAIRYPVLTTAREAEGARVT